VDFRNVQEIAGGEKRSPVPQILMTPKLGGSRHELLRVDAAVASWRIAMTHHPTQGSSHVS
jgi:hypothetical protein